MVVLVGFDIVFDPVPQGLCFRTEELFLLIEKEAVELVEMPGDAPKSFLARETFGEFCLEVEEIPSDFDGL